MDNIYYVYAILDPRVKNEELGYSPFYIGKGMKDRCYTHLKNNKDNKNKVAIIEEIRKDGLEPIVVKILENLDEKTAYQFEKEYIRKYGVYGKGILTNICDDCRPPSRKGTTISSEQKEIISKCARIRLLGKTYEELYGIEGAKIVKHNVGLASKRRAKDMTQATRDKLSESNSRSYVEIYGSIEEAKKQAESRSLSRKGKKRTPEQIKRIIEGRKNKKIIPSNSIPIVILGVSFINCDQAVKFFGISASTLIKLKNAIQSVNITEEDLVLFPRVLKKLKLKLETL